MNICMIFIACLEWKRICVGFVLLAWSGCESMQDFYWLLGVEMHICRIFIACLQWKRICAGFVLLIWSGKKLCRILTACLECKWICAGYLLLVYVCIGVGDSVILLNPCILCACHKLRPGFSMSHVVVVYDLIWSERLLFLLLIFVILLTITLYNYFSKLSGRNIV